DMDKAIADLRKAGSVKAAKKAGRTAAEGLVMCKVSEDGSFGAMVEINSETDFAARESNFTDFTRQVLDQAFERKEDDISKLVDEEMENSRLALIQKIGENISIRRVALAGREDAQVGTYVHSNNRIAVM